MYHIRRFTHLCSWHEPPNECTGSYSWFCFGALIVNFPLIRYCLPVFLAWSSKGIQIVLPVLSCCSKLHGVLIRVWNTFSTKTNFIMAVYLVVWWQTAKYYGKSRDYGPLNIAYDFHKVQGHAHCNSTNCIQLRTTIRKVCNFDAFCNFPAYGVCSTAMVHFVCTLPFLIHYSNIAN